MDTSALRLEIKFLQDDPINKALSGQKGVNISDHPDEG